MLSSLFIGATGLKTHAEGMQVTGNNIANVNTVGYKNAQIRFGDLISDNIVSASGNGATGMSQAGLGVGVQDVVTSFSQGAFETSNEPTDVAISGNGYFAVRDPDNEGDVFYTRAGNFRFNNEGFLVDPYGNRVQGKGVGDDGAVSEETTDVLLGDGTGGRVQLAAKPTESITFSTNLDGSAPADPSTPSLASMFENYNGQATGAPLTPSQILHEDTIRVFDSEGEPRSLSVYYGSVGVNEQNGDRIFGYIASIPPSEDGSAQADTSTAGIVLSGTLTFNNRGELVSQSAYNYSGEGDPTDLNNWSLASLAPEGAPSFTATFADGATLTAPINFGLTSTTGEWNGDATLASAVTGGAELPTFAAERDVNTSTAFQGTSYNLFQDQDGFPPGDLLRVRVDDNGTIVGKFSNGEDADLYQLTLYEFTNPYGLTREGGNLYSTNVTTGLTTEGTPDDGFFGKVAGGALETSNTDLEREFTTMIITQRGFQANSKIITTSDGMLQTAIQLKR